MKIRTFALRNLLMILWPLCVMAAQRSEEVALPAIENVQQQLISASKAGDADRIRTLLTQGALLCQKDRSGYTPFEWAAIYGHVACLHIFLGELENNTPSDCRGPYYVTLKAIKRFNVNLDIFQRDAQSTELTELARCILKIYDEGFCDDMGFKWDKDIVGCGEIRSKVYERLQVQLSLNIVLNCFSSGDNVLQQALLSAGADRTTDDPHKVILSFLKDRHFYYHSREYRQALLYAGARPDGSNCPGGYYEERIREYHFNTLMRFAIHEEREDLLCALIATKTSLTKTYDWENPRRDSGKTLLHIAGELDRARMVKLLIDAGAPIEQEGRFTEGTAFDVACKQKSLNAAQVLFESGASIKATYTHELVIRHLGKQPFYKMLLQGGKVRYVPTRNDAKIAMQTIARLIYTLNHLPAYVIYEIILFAAGEQNDEQGLLVTPKWTRSLRNSLAVLYLYKCNGNKLFPIWEQTIKCLVKDPQQQALVISKLENFFRPFLGNDVIKIACSHLMQKIAKDAEQSKYENDLFGEDFEPYYKHMAQGPLKIDGSDTP